jgi:hypothetical protein
MKVQDWRKAAFILAILGIVLFFIIITPAILFYPGGYKLNPAAPGYSFFQNSWSDLGRTVAWSGQNNFISQIFFSIAMVVWGISFVPSIYALSSLVTISSGEKKVRRTILILAIISVLTLYIDVFFFPEDLYQFIHWFFAFISYMTLFFMEVLFAIVMFSDESYPNTHAICFLAVATAIAIFSIFGGAILQKTITFTLTATTLFVFFDAIKMIKKNH